MAAELIHEEADLVVVEGGHHGGPAHARLGLPATATVNRIRQPVLILRDGRQVEGRIFVVFEGTAQSEKALRMASILTQDSNAITVLVPERDDTDIKALGEREREILGDEAGALRIERFSADTLEGLCAKVGSPDTGLVVMGADNPLMRAGDVAGLLETLTCTLLLVH